MGEPFHRWGEEDFDWEGLSNAADMISNYCRRWGRLGCNTKEKWGQLRADMSRLGYVQLHDIIFPGYAFSHFPKWLWQLDCRFIAPVLHKCWKPIAWWQKKVYNRAYQKALKKYPHLREEILVDAEWPEYIAGAMEIHNKYWTA